MNPLNAILVNSAQKLVNALHKQGNDMLGQALATIVQLHAIICAFIYIFRIVPEYIPDGIRITVAVVVLWTMYYRINRKLEIPTSKNIVLTLFLGGCINLIACFLGGMLLTIIARLLSLLFMLPLVDYGVNMFIIYIFTYLSGLSYFKVLTFLSEKNKFVRRG